MLNRKKRNYTVSSDKKKLQLDFIFTFLSTSYWASSTSKSLIKKSIKNSNCYGIYHFEKQIGFARVVTDYSRIAYLADVFIIEDYRNKGLAKFLLDSIFTDPDIESSVKWILATKDAHKLYAHFDFVPLKQPKKYMQMKKTD